MNGSTGLFFTAITVFCVYFNVEALLQCYSCESLKTAKGCQKVLECEQDQVCMLRRTTDNTSQEILYESRCETKLECDKELKRYRAILTALVGRKREMTQVLLGEVCLIQCCDQDLCNNGCIKPSDLPLTASTTVVSSTKLPVPPLRTLDSALVTSSTDGGLFTREKESNLTSTRKLLVPTKPPKTSTQWTSPKTSSVSITPSNSGYPVFSFPTASTIVFSSTIASPSTTTPITHLQANISSTFNNTTEQSTQSFSGQSLPSGNKDPNTLNGATSVQAVSSTAISTQEKSVSTKYIHVNQSTTSTISLLSLSQSKPTVPSTDFTSRRPVLTTTQLISRTDCPDGSVVFENSCYMFVRHEMSFKDAKGFCARYQSHLVHIDSLRENKFLKNQLAKLQQGPAQFWIGITDAETENEWKFYDNGKVANFYDWYPGEPDGTQTFDGNANADCAVFDPFLNYQWRDEDCSPYQYSEPVCEMEYQKLA